jgi:hypothetical protein
MLWMVPSLFVASFFNLRLIQLPLGGCVTI